MNPLPAPPADPLHILPPWSFLAAVLAALLLLGLLALFLVRRWLRRREAAEPGAPPVPKPPPAAGPVKIGAEIERLRQEFLRSKDFREGCHALAALAKAHLARRTGLGVEEMTSSEIAGAVKAPRVGELMTRLARRRYGRKEPERKHFVEACDGAREVLDV